MSVAFVKYCPLCDEENLSIASFCEKCDGDLINARITARRESELAEPFPGAVDAVSPAAITPDGPSKAQPYAPNQNETATRRVDSISGAIELELVPNPAVKFTVRPGQTVGRASAADVVLTGVPDLEYISRAHVRFLRRRLQWYVQYIAEGNSITVDGVVVQDSSEIALYDNSIVVLSFTPFRVKMSADM